MTEAIIIIFFIISLMSFLEISSTFVLNKFFVASREYLLKELTNETINKVFIYKLNKQHFNKYKEPLLKKYETYLLQPYLDEISIFRYPRFSINLFKASNNEKFMEILKMELERPRVAATNGKNETFYLFLELLSTNYKSKNTLNELFNNYFNNFQKFNQLIDEYEVRNKNFRSSFYDKTRRNEYIGVVKIIEKFSGDKVLMSAISSYLSEAEEIMSDFYNNETKDSKLTRKVERRFKKLTQRVMEKTQDSIDKNIPLEWLYHLEG